MPESLINVQSFCHLLIVAHVVDISFVLHTINAVRGDASATRWQTFMLSQVAVSCLQSHRVVKSVVFCTADVRSGSCVVTLCKRSDSLQ